MHVHYKPPENAKEQIKKLLASADRNNDGCYTKDELQKAFKDLGSYLPGWRAQFCLWEVDANSDGQITGDEIERLISYIFKRVEKGHYKIK